MMINFANFLNSKAETITESNAAGEASASNTSLGQAYETATALKLHSMTGSKLNKSVHHQQRMKLMKQLHNKAMNELPLEKRKQVLEYADNSARAYLDSLKKNKNINPADIHEVHHTYSGIDKVIGKKVDQASNPHDVAIVTKRGEVHGASLKFKPGTLSNSTANTFDVASNNAGIKTNISGVWNEAKKKAGLTGLSGKEIKARRDDPAIKKANSIAQAASAKHHAEAFNSAKPSQKKKMIQSLMKTNPDVDYDYVVGSKSTAEPITTKKHTILVNKAKDFRAEHTAGGLVHVYDHNDNHIMTYEHRPTHGAFSSIQVNGKLGTGKPRVVHSTLNVKPKFEKTNEHGGKSFLSPSEIGSGYHND